MDIANFYIEEFFFPLNRVLFIFLISLESTHKIFRSPSQLLLFSLTKSFSLRHSLCVESGNFDFHKYGVSEVQSEVVYG